MSEIEQEDPAPVDPIVELRQRAERLETELSEVRRTANERVVRAELRAEAIRMGMIDLDGLKLLDLANISVDEDGSCRDASVAMENLKQRKPWLFGRASSATPASPPPARPARAKLATEMSEAEYRAAKAALIRHAF
jgi:hypothetical protein